MTDQDTNMVQTESEELRMNFSPVSLLSNSR